jgi:hypothetical protein
MNGLFDYNYKQNLLDKWRYWYGWYHTEDWKYK